MKYFLSELKYITNDILSSNVNFNKKNISELRKNGFTTIENFLSDEECKLYKESIDELANHEQAWQDNEGSDSRIFGIEKLAPIFNKLFDKNKMYNVFKKYIYKGELHEFKMAAKMKFTNSNIGSGGGWHRDTINRRQLKFIVYLNDVNDKNGCFQYIPKSHTVWNKLKFNKSLNKSLSAYRYSEEEIKKLKNDFGVEVLNLTGKKGTVLIADTSGIHRGRPMEEGIRYAVTNYMSDVPFSKSLNKVMVKI